MQFFRSKLLLLNRLSTSICWKIYSFFGRKMMKKKKFSNIKICIISSFCRMRYSISSKTDIWYSQCVIQKVSWNEFNVAAFYKCLWIYHPSVFRKCDEFKYKPLASNESKFCWNCQYLFYGENNRLNHRFDHFFDTVMLFFPIIELIKYSKSTNDRNAIESFCQFKFCNDQEL